VKIIAEEVGNLKRNYVGASGSSFVTKEAGGKENPVQPYDRRNRVRLRRLSYFLLFKQIMRVHMTIEAAIEFAQQFCTVRSIMAVRTLGNYTMFICVAEYTLELGMFCRASLQGSPDFTMASAAIGIINRFGKRQGQRLMRLMAGHTVFELLSLAMRLMTVKAVRPEPMLFMAEGAGKAGMRRDMGVYFLHY
jgi:hypothetical protein